jgi:Fur family ferric uptake transcriptional regulator
METSTSYKTKQRDQILECLIQNKDRHVTADELMTQLSGDNAPVGKTTIYRYLDKLVSQGIVRKYFIEEGKSACYQYMDADSVCNEHFHLKCIGCGKLVHLECKYMGTLDSHIREHHDFAVDHSKTVLYGKCRACTDHHEYAGAEDHSAERRINSGSENSGKEEE